MKVRIITDTTDFTSIDNGDKILINETLYKVTGHAHEVLSGIEDPKFWVKRVVDVDSGERKIIKLTFLENFETTIGGAKIKCFRDPNKEGKILELVQEHPHFMQGKPCLDAMGNNVRILDVVHGPNFLSYIHSIKMKYDMYFSTVLPGILKMITKAFYAIRFLHESGYKHGDIRNDHLIVDKDNGNLVWIDFDYDFITDENPYSLDVFGLGNILAYAIGKGFHNYYAIANDPDTYGDLVNRLEPEDFSLLEKQRLFNLRKLYPIIPKTLNHVLLHFSRGTEIYYETVDDIIEDLNRCLQAFY